MSTLPSQDSLNQSVNSSTSSFLVETKQYQLFGTAFDVTSRYDELQAIGIGAFGLVCAAKDVQTGTLVAIKKVKEPFSSPVLAKRSYREVRLLNDLRHENIISLMDLYISPSKDIYLVTELLGTDLQKLLSSRKLEKHFINYFLYQILRGLKYVHSANVVHRDLKPSNILVNENCDVKICDFGLARLADTQMTGYVSTRFYRAPEIMLTWQKYDKAVDIWSVGCIMAEMIQGKPLFPGKDHVHQFQLIIDLLGTPPPDVMSRICSENTLKFVRSLPLREKMDMKNHFPDVDNLQIDLLEKMLHFDPHTRINAETALSHPVFELFHDESEEPVAESPFDWAFYDDHHSVEFWKEMMDKELEKYMFKDK